MSNLEIFDREGYSLPCPNDLQEVIQAKIAKKVEKLLNEEGFLALIPNFHSTEDIKLRIHLTKNGITIQLLERGLEGSKVNTSYVKKNPELSKEIKTRKEKIIKKVDSLFKEPPFLDPSARLQSEKIRPLFIPLQFSKDEQAACKISFDATLSNLQIQQLQAKIEDLQNQLNKKTSYSKELQIIKDQLELLSQSIRALSLKQENITYPHTEEYALINKLVDNQQDIYRALLDLLSRNLYQTSNTTPLTPASQDKDKQITELNEQIKNSDNTYQKLEKQLSLLRQEKEKSSLFLIQKEDEIAILQEELKNLSPLPLQLSHLQQEKVELESERIKLIEQLAQARKDQIQLTANYHNQAEQLEKSNKALQTQLSIQDMQTAELDKQIKNVDSSRQKLEEQYSLLQQELVLLKQSNSLLDKNYKEASQLLVQKEKERITLQETLRELSPLPLQLSHLQQEKVELESERARFTEQLAQAKKAQTALSEELESASALLQTQLSTKDVQISELNEEMQRLSKAYQTLQDQLKDEEEIASILETATLPAISNEVASISATIEQAENKMEQDLSSLENSTIPENLFIPTSGYYTLTATASQEESLEITTLQTEINTLREELEDIRPIAYNTTRKIEKMEKSNKDLVLELSEKTRTIEDLEEEKKFLESRLHKSESQLKDLQRVQHILKEQQKEISISSEENHDLLEELEKIQKRLSLETRKRAELEQAHEDQLEKLKDLHNKLLLEKMERVHTKILSLQQQQKNTCFTLIQVLASYINAGSVTGKMGQNIFSLIEKAFDTDGYTDLLNLVVSEDLVTSEENVSSDEYDEDSYILHDFRIKN
ncbi:MAG: hypothetical protein LBC45_02210 [Chlamydiales bacterium]|nr:hypothetical protein [Chlamydiales bacterium]